MNRFGFFAVNGFNVTAFIKLIIYLKRVRHVFFSNVSVFSVTALLRRLSMRLSPHGNAFLARNTFHSSRAKRREPWHFREGRRQRLHTGALTDLPDAYSHAVIIVLSCICLSLGQSRWEWRNPLPQGNDLNAITFGNGRFVAVGACGTILSSYDAATWANRSWNTTVSLNGIAYGNNQFIAVGASGTILSSPDGVSWTKQSSGTSQILNGVAYGSNQFVAVGYSGTILTSIDGITWTSKSGGTTLPLKSVTYGSNQFVAVGLNIIASSTDAATWTHHPPDTFSTLSCVTHGNGHFLALGQAGAEAMVGSGAMMYTSPDGAAWTREAIEVTPLQSAAFGSNKFAAVGQFNIALFSADDSIVSYSNISYALYGIVFGNGQFVTVGEGGRILASSNGTTWTTKSSDIFNYPNNINTIADVTFGNGSFVAAGEGSSSSGSIAASVDGVSWTIKAIGPSMHKVFFGNNQFVAFGDRLWTSSDAENWTSRAWPANMDFPKYDIAFGNSQFVLIGTSIVTSPDCSIWTLQSAIIGYPLNSVTFGDNRFVIVGNGGEILTSPDGITWTNQSSGTSNDLYDVTYGLGQFVAVGKGNALFVSPDAVQWESRPLPSNYLLKNVIFGNNQFVAAGPYGPILSSPDATTWTTHLPAINTQLYSITYGNGQFIAIGNYGTILSSQAHDAAVLHRSTIQITPGGMKIRYSNHLAAVCLPCAFDNCPLTVELFSCAGKRIRSFAGASCNARMSIPIAGLSAGAYRLAVTDDQGRKLHALLLMTH